MHIKGLEVWLLQWTCAYKRSGSVVVTMVSYLTVVLNLSSRDGVARKLIASLRCRCVRFNMFIIYFVTN